MDIAVIGAACRLPDAPDPETFWRNLDAGRVSLRQLSDVELRAAGVGEELRRSADYVAVGAPLAGADEFAAGFFGYRTEEAETIDPQQRLFLEVCWEALESAGHPPAHDGPVTGVFAGQHMGPYSAQLLAQTAQRVGWAAALDDVALHLGGLGDFLTARVAYKLGLRGPTVGIQTACSSALHAVHFAAMSLRAGECDIALAGGSTVIEPATGYRSGGAGAVDGVCRPFDVNASGTVYTSGVGAVVLRRLDAALDDGDAVLAVIKGSAVGNHGSARAGFTAPSPAGFTRVVSEAMSRAGIGPEFLTYVEAHGAGTQLGDHVELRGLLDGTAGEMPKPGHVGLGSVKANIGHTGAASGIAALLKAVHIAHTGSLPPHPTFSAPARPEMLVGSRFHVSNSCHISGARERNVLVNTFGFGGANAAVVVGSPPAPVRPPAPVPGDDDIVRLVLSAHTVQDLDDMCHRLAEAIERDDPPLGDVAHTLRVGRTGFAERRLIRAPAAQIRHALQTDDPQWSQTVRRKGSQPALGAGTLSEDELHEAWLHGAHVDWHTHAGPHGRRIPLPTYPFKRQRYWALTDHN